MTVRGKPTVLEADGKPTPPAQNCPIVCSCWCHDPYKVIGSAHLRTCQAYVASSQTEEGAEVDELRGVIARAFTLIESDKAGEASDLLEAAMGPREREREPLVRFGPEAIAAAIADAKEREGKDTPEPEDGVRLDWLGDDLGRLEDVRERLEAMPDRTPLRYVIDLIRLEDALEDEGARDL